MQSGESVAPGPFPGINHELTPSDAEALAPEQPEAARICLSISSGPKIKCHAHRKDRQNLRNVRIFLELRFLRSDIRLNLRIGRNVPAIRHRIAA